jgi:hypothetical protein
MIFFLSARILRYQVSLHANWCILASRGSLFAISLALFILSVSASNLKMKPTNAVLGERGWNLHFNFSRAITETAHVLFELNFAADDKLKALAYAYGDSRKKKI